MTQSTVEHQGPVQPDLVDQVAAVLDRAYRTGVPCPPVRDLLPADDIALAYAVQQAQVRSWVAAGRRVVGAKIGLTSAAVQHAFGVFQPDFGTLTADMASPEEAEIDFAALIQPKIEAEVAFVLGRSLAHEQVTIVDVIRATEYLLPALEVVDSRITNWDIAIVDTVADNASSGRYVLGCRPVRLSEVDLRRCGMALDYLGGAGSDGGGPGPGIVGEPVSVGAGAACLGHPAIAVAWLASTLAQAGRPLGEGDLVLSGALGPMVPVAAGSAYRARINGLGEVRAVFSGPKGARPLTSARSEQGEHRSAGSDRP